MSAHPRYQEVAGICEQCPQRARAFFQAYLDLKYDQRLPNIQTHILSNSGVPVVTASAAELGCQVFVPVKADEDISMSWLSQVLDGAQRLVEDELGPANDRLQSVHLCIVDTDSTLVYYKISPGFEPP